MNHERKTAWYREPWVWFIIILFLSAVSFAMVMTVIAIRHSPAELSAPWYRNGVMVKRQRQQEKWIVKLQLTAQLELTTAGRVDLVLHHPSHALTKQQRQILSPNTLQLYCAHPINPGEDQTLLIHKVGEGKYQGNFTVYPKGKRYIMLSPLGKSWYLTAKTHFPHSGDIILHATMST